MYRWITLAVGLIASVLFAEYWMRDKHPRLMRLGISVGSGIAIYLAVSAFWQTGAFFAGMLGGQAVLFVYDLVCRNPRLIFPELCLYLSGDMIWLPICLCNADIWEYAVYMSVFLLCISLALSGRREEKNNAKPASPAGKLLEFYHDRKKHYRILSCLPCAALAPDILILAIAKELSMASALLVSAIFLLLFALGVSLQKEVIGRRNAEYMVRAMTRWQQESRDYMNTIRSQRHDYNLHLHAVSGLINSGNYSACQEYVQKLVSQADDINDIMPVCDPVVGSMLYNMREKARKQGTDIQYHITYDMEDVLCNGFECNKIIGNLLQNAIDALQTPEDRACGIHLSILKRRGNTVIISENPFAGDPDQIARVFEPGYSTKKGHDGIGLSMILRTVRHYGGQIYPEFKKNTIRFVVSIPNKVNLQKGAGH